MRHSRARHHRFAQNCTASRSILALKLFQSKDASLIKPKKPTKTVDIRQFVSHAFVSQNESNVIVRAFVKLTDQGSAKPDEIIRYLMEHCEHPLTVQKTIRESITLAESNNGFVIEPNLLDDVVPNGPDKPWGAC